MDIHNNGRNNNKFDRFFNYRNNDDQGMVRPPLFGQWRWLGLSIYIYKICFIIIIMIETCQNLIVVDVTFN
jgi:hypothetical protein